MRDRTKMDVFYLSGFKSCYFYLKYNVIHLVWNFILIKRHMRYDLRLRFDLCSLNIVIFMRKRFKSFYKLHICIHDGSGHFKAACMMKNLLLADVRIKQLY